MIERFLKVLIPVTQSLFADAMLVIQSFTPCFLFLIIKLYLPLIPDVILALQTLLLVLNYTIVPVIQTLVHLVIFVIQTLIPDVILSIQILLLVLNHKILPVIQTLILT